MTMSWEIFSASLAGRSVLTAVFAVGLVVVGGCSSDAREHQYPEQVGGSEQHDPLGHSTNSDAQVGSLLDEGGLVGRLIKRDGDEKKAEDEPEAKAPDGDGAPDGNVDDSGGGTDEEAADGTHDGAAGETASSATDGTGNGALTDAGDSNPEEGNSEDTAAAFAAPSPDGGESGATGPQPQPVQRNPEPQQTWEAAQRHDPKKIGVNAYLWRATLDTLSFLPLNSADPYGGVIITDWRTNPQAPNERVKVTVYILDKKLRADGIRVSVFRQVLTAEGIWIDQPAANETRIQIEDAILTRARQLRVADISED